MPTAINDIRAVDYPAPQFEITKAIILISSAAYATTLAGILPAYFFVRCRHTLTAIKTLGFFALAYGAMKFFEYVPTPFTALTENGVKVVVDSTITWQGWQHILQQTFKFAALGLAAGMLIWVIVPRDKRVTAPLASASLGDRNFQRALSVIGLLAILKVLSFAAAFATAIGSVIALGIILGRSS